jgi:plastocyanin
MKRFVSQYSQRFRSLWVILTVIVVMSLALVAWGGSATTAVASTKVPSLGLKRGHVVHTVKIMEKNGRYFFQPASMTIKVGDVVVWKNVSDAVHTVTSNTEVFDTPGMLSPNETFRFTFTRAGTFKYHCNIHPYMHGTIIVKSVLSSNQGSPSSPPPSMPTPMPMYPSGGGGGYHGGGGGGGGGGGY